MGARVRDPPAHAVGRRMAAATAVSAVSAPFSRPPPPPSVGRRKVKRGGGGGKPLLCGAYLI